MRRPLWPRLQRAGPPDPGQWADLKKELSTKRHEDSRRATKGFEKNREGSAKGREGRKEIHEGKRRTTNGHKWTQINGMMSCQWGSETDIEEMTCEGHEVRPKQQSRRSSGAPLVEEGRPSVFVSIRVHSWFVFVNDWLFSPGMIRTARRGRTYLKQTIGEAHHEPWGREQPHSRFQRSGSV